jgi:hypothetical protein
LGNAITEAKAGDLVYLKDSYVNLKSGKMTWTLKANLPTINSKNYKMSINNSGYYYHDGSTQEYNNFIPIAIPAFDYIKGTVTITYSLSKAGKCSVPLYVSEYLTGDTGVVLNATITPTYLGTSTSSVDAIQDQCTAGPPPTFEVFTDHSATLAITARALNPNSTFQLGNLFIEKYTIEYRRSTDSIGAPPIQTDTRFVSIVIPAPFGSTISTVSTTVTFVDLLRKDQYRTDVTSGQFSSSLSFLNNYTAIYTFEGKNEFGTKFSFKVQTDFQIADFNNCTG